MARKESREFTLFGDLDGMTVAEIREWLDQFSDDARLDARTEYEGVIGGNLDREFFVFIREE